MWATVLACRLASTMLLLLLLLLLLFIIMTAQDNVDRLTEELKFKDYHLQEKEDELAKLNSVLISLQFDNEVINSGRG